MPEVVWLIASAAYLVAFLLFLVTSASILGHSTRADEERVDG